MGFPGHGTSTITEAASDATRPGGGASGVPYADTYGENDVAWDSNFSWDHNYLTFDGTLFQEPPVKPFAIEAGATKYKSNAKAAAEAGVDLNTVVAFRRGVPYWKLEVQARQVAQYFSVDLAILRARIRRAKNLIWGRRQNSFAGLGDSGVPQSGINSFNKLIQP